MKKHLSSPTHLSATAVLIFLSKVRTVEAVNEDGSLSRTIYNEQVKEIRFRLTRCNVPAEPLFNNRCCLWR